MLRSGSSVENGQNGPNHGQNSQIPAVAAENEAHRADLRPSGRGPRVIDPTLGATTVLE